MFKRILRSFSRTNINLHDKSIYQLPHIFYMVKHLHVYMVSIYISYMIPFYMFVNLLTCWHFDSNQPKKKFSLVVIREAVVPCIEHAVSNTLYYCTSYSHPVRQRLFGVTLTLYQPVDENNKCRATTL